MKIVFVLFLSSVSLSSLKAEDHAKLDNKGQVDQPQGYMVGLLDKIRQRKAAAAASNCSGATTPCEQSSATACAPVCAPVVCAPVAIRPVPRTCYASADAEAKLKKVPDLKIDKLVADL